MKRRQQKPEKKEQKQSAPMRQPKQSNISFKCKNERQIEAVQKIQSNEITFLIGAAGTGKSFLAIAQACKDLVSNKIDKIILTRPVVEAGEELGHLPGTAEEKMAPYMAPLFDHLKKFLPENILSRCIENKQIEIVPLAYTRGRNFDNSYVILDEAQNVSDSQLKMFLTRIGENAKFVICADPEQSDLKKDNMLPVLSNRLSLIDGIALVEFGEEDIVRNPIISKILSVFKDLQA